jgi:3-methyl-2-oxobutanoate hydroxymethyltransferase
VLVIYDMLGITLEFKPKYLRLYADLGGEIRKAVENYIRDVKSGEYPSEKESYH